MAAFLIIAIFFHFSGPHPFSEGPEAFKYVKKKGSLKAVKMVTGSKIMKNSPNFVKFVTAIVIGLLGFALGTMTVSKSQEEAGEPTPPVEERIVPESLGQVLLSFAPVVKKAAPAVVNIYTRRVIQVQTSPFFNDPFFRRFFGENTPFGMPQEP